ncbi:hypothetical protein BDF21DRAFT_422695 [Thamnidium elegans]|nr:hypothetical protein BDF21DRAFT_422695 [Thamnidium elegans]
MRFLTVTALTIGLIQTVTAAIILFEVIFYNANNNRDISVCVKYHGCDSDCKTSDNCKESCIKGKCNAPR